jgi:hypothetical protein
VEASKLQSTTRGTDLLAVGSFGLAAVVLVWLLATVYAIPQGLPGQLISRVPIWVLDGQKVIVVVAVTTGVSSFIRLQTNRRLHGYAYLWGSILALLIYWYILTAASSFLD